ncbi:polysaccharide pyruvyl transferase family protein [Dysgonomonas sp. Marseille-P4361]|uniref:polysaccharide pyruvyl transferase family protein n=1 Tax=Dysgonomonas sp. Marseille-P4361 TaxID=2161820 RepID=UPI000D55E21D|nr:polysaccharide pyruvyl transferase family protein [Dysgonomonas sp. Marseille-P4361]
MEQTTRKRIGILTFHCARNYGAVLQTYALQEFLKSQNNEVDIINYTPSFLQLDRKLYSKKTFKDRSMLGKIKQLIVSPLTYSKKIARARIFALFSNKNLEVKDIDSNIIYDLVIVGSDQVWNLNLTEGEDPFYGGETNKISRNRLISYAASIGHCPINASNCQSWNKYLNNFDDVSVREYSLVEIFENISHKKISNVLDPVLLLGQEKWDRLITDSINEKYVLVYQIYSNKNVIAIANKLANERGAKVIELSSKVDIYTKKSKKENVSVEQFLAYFRYAECVVTTSFHGTAFSIINRKPFYTVKMGEGIDARASDLLNSLGLSNRLIEKSDRPTFQEVNYSEAETLLDNQQANSINFLLRNIK